MLRPTSQLNGYAVHASDGVIGTVSDFLFDDATWFVRWLIIDTGNWLSGRKVLLPPSALAHVNPIGCRVDFELTRRQIKDSPNADTERPVSRQQETNIYDYYSWAPYWGDGSYMDVMGYGGFLGGSLAPPPTAESMRREKEIDDAQRSKNDPTLRSVMEVTGYHIHASDGEIGHVKDFLVEDENWGIHYLVVDTKNWWPGRKVLISPMLVRTIDWSERHVSLRADRQKIKDSPPYDSTTAVDLLYEKRVHNHYAAFR